MILLNQMGLNLTKKDLRHRFHLTKKVTPISFNKFKKRNLFLVGLGFLILIPMIGQANAHEFDPGDGGPGAPTFELNNGNYFSIPSGSYDPFYDHACLTYTSCFDGLDDEYGHFDDIDQIFLNIHLSVDNEDEDGIYYDYNYWDGFYSRTGYREYWSIYVDYLKVSIKIKNPLGNYLSEDLVRGTTQFYVTGGGEESWLMAFLWDSSIELFEGALPYPLNKGLKIITDQIPNPGRNEYTHGAEDANTHFWMFDYGLPIIKSQEHLGIQIVYSPSFGVTSGYYFIEITYEVGLKKHGWYQAWWNLMLPVVFDAPWASYSKFQSIMLIKD